MFDWIRRLFGEHTIRADVVCVDGTRGTVRVQCEGDISTLDHADFGDYVKRYCFVRHGRHIATVKITGRISK